MPRWVTAHRLRMVDALLLGDRTFRELATPCAARQRSRPITWVSSKSAGLIERRVSEGDHRRRYISLRRERLDGMAAAPRSLARIVLFVCTHNSARSQFAAALWRDRTGGRRQRRDPSGRAGPPRRRSRRRGRSASTSPARRRRATTPSRERPTSSCLCAIGPANRALPFPAPSLHWSVPDPVRVGTPDGLPLRVRRSRLGSSGWPSHDGQAIARARYHTHGDAKEASRDHADHPTAATGRADARRTGHASASRRRPSSAAGRAA